eukprot:CAMPEP_0113848156 /NCGR_PEP_ID=MMETSP0372-20130328/2301_1 /TAXON_ID=340204 /ORGANISM="Lankesteria abbotti" /LENGTH=172 /DNA_ID=CAMNT_0000817569 /DNA_START=104 /DNA_END=622 /DNA_ORIENTATION=+ /assembly_acc=CAM_ASM_000359
MGSFEIDQKCDGGGNCISRDTADDKLEHDVGKGSSSSSSTTEDGGFEVRFILTNRSGTLLKMKVEEADSVMQTKAKLKAHKQWPGDPAGVDTVLRFFHNGKELGGESLLQDCRIVADLSYVAHVHVVIAPARSISKVPRPGKKTGRNSSMSSRGSRREVRADQRRCGNCQIM